MNARFESKFMPEPNSGCWLWTASVNHKGYPRFGQQYAHRVSFEMHCEPITGDKIIMHVCDTPACVNPDHLRLGTHKDNAADRDKKGRRRPQNGSLNGSAKINQAIADEIRATPGVHETIAKAFGVSQTTVSSIKAGKRW